jgi:hypothetical protein
MPGMKTTGAGVARAMSRECGPDHWNFTSALRWNCKDVRFQAQGTANSSERTRARCGQRAGHVLHCESRATGDVHHLGQVHASYSRAAVASSTGRSRGTRAASSHVALTPRCRPKHASESPWRLRSFLRFREKPQVPSPAARRASRVARYAWSALALAPRAFPAATAPVPAGLRRPSGRRRSRASA